MKNIRTFFLTALLFLTVNASAFAAGHTVSVSSTNVSCNGVCNGMATANVSGGSGTYSYSWSTAETTSSVSNLCAGTYTVTVTDDSDASTATASVTITEPTMLTVTTSGTNVSCNGGANACIVATASGGTSPYVFMWSTGQTGSNGCGLSAGVYSITVTDANNCFVIANATVTEPPALTASFTKTDNTAGNCDGSISTSVSGGTAPYSYLWNNSDVSPTAGSLCEGLYSVTITDNNGCTLFLPCITIGQASLTISVTPPNPTICMGDTILLTASGAADYSWNNGVAGASFSDAPTDTVTYTIWGWDANGCTDTATVTVNVVDPPSILLSATNAACGNSDGAITSSVSAASSNYMYSWTGPNGFASTSADISGLEAGTYSLTVTDSIGCTGTASANVSNTDGPVITVDSLNNVSCKNGNDGYIAISATGGSPFTFSWNTTPVTTGNIAANLTAGSYIATVTDTAGCQTLQTFTITQPGSLYIALSSTQANCTTNGSATVTVQGGTPSYSYLWSNAQTSSTITGLTGGTFIVTVTDALGCTKTGSVVVKTDCKNVISGYVFEDLNSNCIKDAGEAPIVSRVITTGTHYASTDSTGYYILRVDSGTYTISMASTMNGWQRICPSSGSYTISFPTFTDTSLNNNFGYQIIPGTEDLAAVLYLGAARPGFQQNYSICARNNGTQVMSGTVKFTYDSLLTFYSSYLTPSLNVYPNLEWNFTNLDPGASNCFSGYLSVPTISNGGALGTALNYSAIIEPVTGDVTPSDNTDNEISVITGSYDPNDKGVYPLGRDADGKILITDTIHSYTIRFQNTGTDTAFTVVIKDTLSNLLNAGSIEPMAASHSYTFDLSGEGIASWTFNNILLPDSNVNEPASHGFVKFRIRSKSTNKIGDKIENTAGIYFDFNDAVITNTVINTIAEPDAVEEVISANGRVEVYPNPFSNTTTFVLSPSAQQWELSVYDLTGRKIISASVANSNKYVFKRDGLSDGIYIYKVSAANGMIDIGKIIIR